MPGTLVAFSGGVDSTFLLRVGHDVLGARCVALTTASPTAPAEDLAAARAFEAVLGVERVVVDANELTIPGYAENPVNPCYFCKESLYTICLADTAHRRRTLVVADGADVDDLADHR